MMKKSHEEIWNVLITLAIACDVDYHTAHKHKERGAIPPSRHYDIVQKAQETGAIWVTHKLLHNMWKDSRNQKTKQRRKK